MGEEHGRAFFAFLLGTELHRPDLWEAFGVTAKNAACHRHQGGMHPTLPTVKQVATSWAQTLQAHLALYDCFMMSDATHCVLASESCFPLVDIDTVNQRLVPGVSYFARLQEPCPFIRHRWRAVPRGELAGKPFYQYAVAHEQWTVLARPHVQLMLQHREWLLRNFARSGADNECYSGSLLKLMGERHKMQDIAHHHTRWRERSKHPVTYAHISIEQQAQWRSEGALFARKITPETQIA